MKIFDTSEDVKDYLWEKEFGDKRTRITEEDIMRISKEMSKGKLKETDSHFSLEDITKANRRMAKEAKCEKTGHKEKRGEAMIYFNELHIPRAYVTCKKCGANYDRSLNKEERGEYLLKKIGGLGRIF